MLWVNGSLRTLTVALIFLDQYRYMKSRPFQVVPEQHYGPAPENLQEILADGTCFPWPQRGQTHALKQIHAVNVTQETVRQLRKECDDYLFAWSFDYSELREYSTHGISSGHYRYSADGVLNLMMQV